jgi:hypothetical protein
LQFFLGNFQKKSTLQFETKTSGCFEVRSAFHMADNDNVSVSEARIDASSPGTGQTIAETQAAEDVHNEATTQKTGIDTSAITTTTWDHQQPPEAVAMSNESQQAPPPPPEQGNAVSSEQNGDVAEREEHVDINNVSDLSSDRPPLRDEGFEEVRLDTKGQDKPPQGKATCFSLFAAFAICPH